MSVRIISNVVRLMVLASVSVAAGQAAQGPTPGTSGSATFSLYCASCHGASARGDGPLAASVTKRPPDLTLIARRNNDVFPSDRVTQIIDSRERVKGHSGGDMPVWGDAFTRSANAVAVEERIHRLATYLEQVKP